jgi:hypothetical protein
MMQSIRQNRVRAFDETFGIYRAISTLAGDDITKIEIIKNLPYKDCLTHLLYLKALDETYNKKE